MHVGIDISQHQQTWEELAARASFAEDAGFDSAWVFDHFQPLYGDPSGPCLEGWTLLAALAARTERIRLGALVTGVTYRHPSVLTAEAVTVDHVSNGRLDIGMGAAWFEPEHERLGIGFPPPAVRARMLDEALSVMRLLMTTDGAGFDGEHFTLRDATYRPRPVQRPHPPIWIGAAGRALMLPIAGRHADVWHSFGSPADLAQRWEVVRGAAEGEGRDPAAIGRSTNISISEPWDDVRALSERMAADGLTHLIVSWPSEGRARLDAFVADLLPFVRAL